LQLLDELKALPGKLLDDSELVLNGIERLKTKLTLLMQVKLTTAY
jgi:hypothetical protein